MRLTKERFDEIVTRPPVDPGAAASSTSADPKVLALRTTVTTAHGMVRLEVASRRAHQGHLAWCTPEAVVFLLAVRGEEHDAQLLAPAFFPAAVARVVRLTPRKVTAGGVSGLPSTAAEDLWDPVPEVRAAAFDRLPVAAEWAWRILVTHPDNPDPADARGLLVVDGQESGQCLLVPGASSVDLVPTDGFALFGHLCELLNFALEVDTNIGEWESA